MKNISWSKWGSAVAHKTVVMDQAGKFFLKKFFLLATTPKCQNILYSANGHQDLSWFW